MDRVATCQLADIACSQHGLISVWQARALGLTRNTLAAEVDRGRLRAVRRSVYAVAGAPQSRWQPLTAAALAAGPDAVISHRSAAAIHGFTGIADDGPTELTVPFESRRQLAGVRLHRSRTLTAEDLHTRSGVTLTAPIRTVIDIAGVTGEYLLGRIVDDGTIRRLWTPDDIAGRIHRLGLSGRAGTARLNQLLGQRKGERHQDGQLEQRVLRVIKRLTPKLPEPVIHYQQVMSDRMIDMDVAWPDLRIDGEIDGYQAHSQRSDWERDRLRANVLGAHGWYIVHWTSAMDDHAIAAQIFPYFGMQ